MREEGVLAWEVGNSWISVSVFISSGELYSGGLVE